MMDRTEWREMNREPAVFFPGKKKLTIERSNGVRGVESDHLMLYVLLDRCILLFLLLLGDSAVSNGRRHTLIDLHPGLDYTPAELVYDSQQLTLPLQFPFSVLCILLFIDGFSSFNFL
jgi:hypothetical protein